MDNYEILPEDFPKYDLSFKMIIIGDSGTGKSCFSSKAIRNAFEEYSVDTVGYEFLTFNIRINNEVIQLQTFDTCGKEMYKSLISNFYRNSSLAIIIYSIDNKESFQNIKKWLKEVKNANFNAKIILVGNKSDLEESRKVSKDEGENFAKENNLNMFFETSAKTGHNAQNVFIEAVKLLYKEYIKSKKEKEKKINIKKEEEEEIKKEEEEEIKKEEEDEIKKEEEEEEKEIKKEEEEEIKKEEEKEIKKEEEKEIKKKEEKEIKKEEEEEIKKEEEEEIKKEEEEEEKEIKKEEEEIKKEEKEEKGEDSEEKEEEEKDLSIGELKKKKCSLNEHKENAAKSFCPECKIYMCPKCEKIHSGLCQ